LIYDYDNQKAEVVFSSDGKRTRVAYIYDRNEIFTFIGGTYYYKKIANFNFMLFF
jgi:hypothetical protein